MEIYPYRQLQALLFAFSTGLFFGFLWEMLQAAHVLIGAYLPPADMKARYQRPLPFLQTGVPFPKGGGRRLFRAVVVFFADALYCLCFCMAIVLLLYHFEDGAWRISVVVSAFLGLALFRTFSARFCARGRAYLAYFLAVLYLYIKKCVCWPADVLSALIKRFLLWPIAAFAAKMRKKRLSRTSLLLCQAQLRAAACGRLYGVEGERSDVKKKAYPHAMDHSDPDRAAVLRGAFCRLRTADRVERGSKKDRGAGKAKGRAAARRRAE